MATKMKGLFKGLRYISQIFDDQKHKEMQIGCPTDVKHVAHIGWEGPSALDSPSWMKEFNSTNSVHSAPLTMTGEPRENDHLKWVSQDSHRIPRGSPDGLKPPVNTRRNSSREVSSAESDDQDLEYSRKNRNLKKNTGNESASQRSRSARHPNNPGSGLPVNHDDFKKTRSTRQPKEPKERVPGSDYSVDPEGTRKTRSTRQPKEQNSGSEDPEGSVRTRRKSKESGSDSIVLDPEGSVKTRKKSKETGSDYSTDPEGSRRTRSTRQQKDQNSGAEDPEGSVRTRKKSKESVNGGGPERLKSKANAPIPPASHHMDLGPDPHPGNMGGSGNR